MIYSCRSSSSDSSADPPGRLDVCLKPSDQVLRDVTRGCFMTSLVSWSLQQVDISVMLTFMEYLHSQNCKVASISNYMAALRAFFILYDLPTTIFKDQKIQYFIKVLQLNRPLHLRNTPIFTEHIVSETVQVCTYIEHPHVFTTVYLLAFFSFMRLSKIVPHSRAQYDYIRHLAS